MFLIWSYYYKIKVFNIMFLTKHSSHIFPELILVPWVNTAQETQALTMNYVLKEDMAQQNSWRVPVNVPNVMQGKLSFFLLYKNLSKSLNMIISYFCWCFFSAGKINNDLFSCSALYYI